MCSQHITNLSCLTLMMLIHLLSQPRSAACPHCCAQLTQTAFDSNIDAQLTALLSVHAWISTPCCIGTCYTTWTNSGPPAPTLGPLGIIKACLTRLQCEASGHLGMTWIIPLTLATSLPPGKHHGLEVVSTSGISSNTSDISQQVSNAMYLWHAECAGYTSCADSSEEEEEKSNRLHLLASIMLSNPCGTT